MKTKPTILGCIQFWLWSDYMTPPEHVIYERVTKIGHLGIPVILLSAGFFFDWDAVKAMGFFALFFWWWFTQAINSKKLREYYGRK
jgi:hypothetical protein